MEHDELRSMAAGKVQELMTEASPGCMVTQFLVLAVTMDQDGEKGMWALTPPDQRKWESLGLMEYHKQLSLASEVEAE
jgi:hypothetical protein